MVIQQKQKGKSLVKKLFKADRNSAVENNVFENNDSRKCGGPSHGLFLVLGFGPRLFQGGVFIGNLFRSNSVKIRVA